MTAIQRFGSGLRLNVHFHTLVLDGVFSHTRSGPLTFHPAPPPSDADVAHILAIVRARELDGAVPVLFEELSRTWCARRLCACRCPCFAHRMTLPVRSGRH